MPCKQSDLTLIERGQGGKGVALFKELTVVSDEKQLDEVVIVDLSPRWQCHNPTLLPNP
jgi:hypothetical protein